MTNGTSQGLFVVVAIVIFGIFIGLTYTLFGSEGLSNDLKGIFTNATEQTNTGINNSKYYSEQIDKITADADFEFDKTTGTITNYIGTSKDIVIPYEIEGVDVKFIGESSFKSKRLTKVVFPNTINEIGDYAFQGNSLTSIKLPNSVTKVGLWSFWNNQILNMDLGNSIENLGYGALAWNVIEVLELPESLKTIDNDAFKGNRIKKVVIPNSVDTLGSNTFSNMNYLKDIRVPKKFKTAFETNNKYLIKKYENDIDGSMIILEYYNLSDITFY